MTRDNAIAKLISVRHHCFARGVLGRRPQDDFRQAFRTVNQRDVQLLDEIAPESVRKGRKRLRTAA
jgi:hypothetical protein